MNKTTREISTNGNQFKRDVKKHCQKFVTREWVEVLDCLVKDIPLPEKYRDHGLEGQWKDCRDCHINPDLVLIYRKTENRLQLIRLGTHSELFG